MDSTYSYLKGMISEEDLHRIINLFQKLNFAVHIPELSGENLLKGLEEFREHLGGQLTIMLLDEIGKGVEVHQMDSTVISNSADKLQEFQEEGFKFA
ncbi:hypothetical protein LZ575_18320 [Antarcticibacterium sp. 1MA-6-2]|uniref:hypothetical protein n=1 Tax=Antarcticibacterium sp. 1MA-6-2 TaxID=2908210 RepID=UPI001F2412CB|nr:hypothetical protein [Antarcticibacterium sp. 1MA-6-2]UJH90699.1 hypothetical protein LZ575_18320 [Antarcticibacterium sp. 1MA-6-2]